MEVEGLVSIFNIEQTEIYQNPIFIFPQWILIKIGAYGIASFFALIVFQCQ